MKAIFGIVALMFGVNYAFDKGMVMLPCQQDFTPKIGSFCSATNKLYLGDGLTFVGDFNEGKPYRGTLTFWQIVHANNKRQLPPGENYGSNSSKEFRSKDLNVSTLQPMKDFMHDIEVQELLSLGYDYQNSLTVVIKYAGHFLDMKPHGEGDFRVFIVSGNSFRSVHTKIGLWERGSFIKKCNIDDLGLDIFNDDPSLPDCSS